jgi:6-phosphofructo-2-kinase
MSCWTSLPKTAEVLASSTRPTAPFGDVNWLSLATGNGQVTNSTSLESCCYDAEFLETNFRLKLSRPDYQSQIPGQAFADFCQRVARYEGSYVPLSAAEEEPWIPYVQMIDVARKINTHRIQRFLETQVVDYLLKFNLSERQIWISCSGESLHDATGKVWRNSNLGNNGGRYSGALARFV